MAALGQVIGLGALLGVGAAFAVGPIFVAIIQQAATRGVGAGVGVILGSAVADLLLLLPALAFAWVISLVASAALWVGLIGTLAFHYLAQGAARDALRLWRDGEGVRPAEGWAFWKGVAGNLANPLTWTFWLATGTPTMARVGQLAGAGGVVVFTATWFAVASGLETLVAVAVARSGRLVGSRGQAAFTAVSALMFLALALNLVVTDVLPHV